MAFTNYRSIIDVKNNPREIPLLSFLFLKAPFLATSDLWWILRENYKEHPERFQLLSLEHESKNETDTHFNVGYQVSEKFQQTYHVYFENTNGKMRYTYMTGEGLNRSLVVIVQFK
jgi:hypothetical protein